MDWPVAASQICSVQGGASPARAALSTVSISAADSSGSQDATGTSYQGSSPSAFAFASGPLISGKEGTGHDSPSAAISVDDGSRKDGNGPPIGASGSSTSAGGGTLWSNSSGKVLAVARRVPSGDQARASSR